MNWVWIPLSDDPCIGWFNFFQLWLILEEIPDHVASISGEFRSRVATGQPFLMVAIPGVKDLGCRLLVLMPDHNGIFRNQELLRLDSRVIQE